eukprot:14852778-Alexandrium_andersonii.AAC.1
MSARSWPVLAMLHARCCGMMAFGVPRCGIRPLFLRPHVCLVPDTLFVRRGPATAAKAVAAAP